MPLYYTGVLPLILYFRFNLISFVEIACGWTTTDGQRDNMIKRLKGRTAADQIWMQSLSEEKRLEVESHIFHNFKLTPNYSDYSVHAIAINHEEINGMATKVAYDSARFRRAVVTDLEPFIRSLVSVWDLHYFKIGLPGDPDVRTLHQAAVDPAEAAGRARAKRERDAEPEPVRKAEEARRRLEKEQMFLEKKRKSLERVAAEEERRAAEKQRKLEEKEKMLADGVPAVPDAARSRRKREHRRLRRAEQAAVKEKATARELAKLESKERAKRAKAEKPVLPRALLSLSSELKW